MEEKVMIYLNGNPTPLQVTAQKGFNSLEHDWRTALTISRPITIRVNKDVTLNSHSIAAIILVR